METEWVGQARPTPRRTTTAPPPRRWRRWLGALLAVLLVVGLVHLGAGWYYASQIQSQALTINPWQVPLDERLEGSDPDSVTIRDVGPPNIELRTEGTYELVWKGGSMMIGGRPQIEGDLVTRQIEGTAALPPAGSPVGVSPFVSDPDLPLPRRVDYPDPLGTMHAQFLPGTPETWAILVHGKGSSPDEMHRMMGILRRFGVQMLAIDYRNDPGNPADPSHQYQYGATEWADLAAAVNYARQHGARHLVLAGASMGGAIVASYLRHASDTHDVAGVILDAPMLDLRSTVEWGAEHLAVTPPPTFTWTAEEVASLRFGLDWDAVDYLHGTPWATVPTLVLHGEADSTVPLATSEKLRDESPDVTLVEFPGAEHVESWNVAPARYDGAVSQFLHHVLPWQVEILSGP